MDIKHEILGFHAATGSITVRYYCDEVPDGLAYNIDIPLENGAYVGQDRIDELIEALKPIGQLERLAALKTATPPYSLATMFGSPKQV